MSFLGLNGKTFLVVGVANKKSVAYFISKVLLEEGARVLLSVQNEKTRDAAAALLPNCPLFICDVRDPESIEGLARDVAAETEALSGMVHSIAYAPYSEGLKPFHEVKRDDFLLAADVSMFSLVMLANACKDLFTATASVVTLSISTTRMASENYGYMAPIKAALDASVCFLAKSFSRFSQVRFNSVNPSLLKTSASAGIPGYLESYLYAEQVIPRGEALKTEEVANVAAFLLSERSSGITAQNIVVDAGMGINYFDQAIVKRMTRIQPD